MMSGNTLRTRTTDGFVVCFLAATMVATLVYNLSMLIVPGTFLPTSLTLRSSVTNTGIMDGISSSAEDAGTIAGFLSGSGNISGAGAWSLLSGNNFDLFFIVSIVFPSAARVILTAGMFIRFGLACSFTYYLCCAHIGLGRTFSAILGFSYAFSAQLLLTAQFVSIGNLAVLLPCFMAVCDSFLRRRNVRTFAFLSVVSCLIISSGTCGRLSGIPFMIAASILISAGLYDSFRSIAAAFGICFSGILTGLVMSGFVLVPVLCGSRAAVDFPELIGDSKENYTMFDFFTRMFCLKSGNMSSVNPPLFYIGMITITALVIFFINSRIPFRVKITVSVLFVLYFVSCASSVARAVTALGLTRPAIVSSRLVCLGALLIFTAALSLRNLYSLKSFVFYAAAIIPVSFLIVSVNSSSDTTVSAQCRISSFIVLIAWAFVLKCYSEGRLGRKSNISLLVIYVTLIGINSFFVICNNDISSDSVNMAFENSDGNDDDSVQIDPSFDLSVFSASDNLKYLLLSSDLSGFNGSTSYIDSVNAAGGAALAGNIFEKQEYTLTNCTGVMNNGMNNYSFPEGLGEIGLRVNVLPDTRLYVFSGVDRPVTLSSDSLYFGDQKEYDGPFLSLVDTVGEADIALEMNCEPGDSGDISVQLLNERNCDALNSVTGQAASNDFTFDYDDVPGWESGNKTIVFSLPYASDYFVRVNGKKVRTFEFAGRLAAVVAVSEQTAEYEVSIDRTVPGIGAGIAATVLSLSFIVLLSAVNKVKRNKTQIGVGEKENDAQQKDY